MPSSNIAHLQASHSFYAQPHKNLEIFNKINDAQGVTLGFSQIEVLTLYTMSEDMFHDDTEIKNIWTVVADTLERRLVHKGLHTHPI